MSDDERQQRIDQANKDAVYDYLHHGEPIDSRYDTLVTELEKTITGLREYTADQAEEIGSLRADSRRLDALLDPEGPFIVSYKPQKFPRGQVGIQRFPRVVHTRAEIDEALGEDCYKRDEFGNIIRCLITGHPYGTDTRPLGVPCACENCTKVRLGEEPDDE